MEFKVNSEGETKALACKMSEHLHGGMNIGFVGALGSGKTTFIRYLVEALGAKQEVSSPSYVLEHEYKGREVNIQHWDLYRLAALPLELFEPPGDDTLRLVEWADKDKAFFDGLDVSIFLDLEDTPESRRIEILGIKFL